MTTTVRLLARSKARVPNALGSSGTFQPLILPSSHCYSLFSCSCFLQSLLKIHGQSLKSFSCPSSLLVWFPNRNPDVTSLFTQPNSLPIWHHTSLHGTTILCTTKNTLTLSTEEGARSLGDVQSSCYPVT